MRDKVEKNKAAGSMSNIGKVDIGDKITNVYQNANATIPKELTLYLPKTHPYDIIGRENDLDELHQLLGTEKRVVLVNGLGGIGKTTLAQAYVHKYYAEYQHIAWIVLDSDNLANDFVNTPGLIENLGIETGDFQPLELFPELIRRLKVIPDKPNLIVIDNAEQLLKQYRDILPSQPDWHLLVTSREDIQGFCLKTLDFLSLDKAVELFKKHYTHKKLKEDEVTEVVKMVDRHTLTVEILAKTAEELRYDIDTLKIAIANDLKASIDVAHNKKYAGINKITSYLGTIFNLSKLTESEVWLMKQFACLPSEFHSYELLNDLLTDKDDVGSAVFIAALNSLAQKGWLLRDKEGDSYKMHRIVIDVTKGRNAINVADVETLISSITERLLSDRIRDNPLDKFTWIPFAITLLANFGTVTTDEISVLRNNLASGLYELGDYQDAKALLEKTVASTEKNFGADHPTTAITYSNLAVVLWDLGDYKKAKELLEKATASDENNFGADHPTTAIRYSNLALVLKAIGDYPSAKLLLEKAIENAEKNFGVDHLSTAIRYSNLALVLQDMGDYQGAKMLLEKATASAVKNFGVDHPTTATRYSNLAVVLKDLGDNQAAKVLLEKAIASDEKHFGTDHPATANRYHNLSTVLYHLEDYDVALARSNTALAIFNKTLPDGHPIIKTVHEWNEKIKRKMKQ